MASRTSVGATPSHTGGRPPKKVKLKLTVEGVDRETGEVTAWSFKQESGEQCVDRKGDLDFKDKAKWNAGIEIGFKVDNESDCTMAFADTPLWVAAGACPRSPSSDPNFQVVSGAGSLDLTVLDLNGSEGTYGYALRFKSDDSKTGFFLLDPIVINGGGGNEALE